MSKFSLQLFLMLFVFVVNVQAQKLTPVVPIDMAKITLQSSDPLVKATSWVNHSTRGSLQVLQIISPRLSTSSLKALERKTLLVAIPIAVPPHLRLKIIGTHELGMVSGRSLRSSSQLSSEVFLAGSRGIELKKSMGRGHGFIGLQSNQLILGACGQDVILRLNKSLLSKSATLGSLISEIDFELEPCR